MLIKQRKYTEKLRGKKLTSVPLKKCIIGQNFTNVNRLEEFLIMKLQRVGLFQNLLSSQITRGSYTGNNREEYHTTVLPTSVAIKNMHHRIREDKALRLLVSRCVCVYNKDWFDLCVWGGMRWLMNCMSNKLSTGLFAAFLAFGLKNNFTSQCVSLKPISYALSLLN